jgi:CRISPR system Cascade subunit CasE
MTTELHFSRARLRRDATVQALLPLLQSGNNGSHHPGHHLVWSLFADAPDRRRDFLWREMERGTFLILSARRPVDHHPLFDIDAPKPFAPVLKAGDRLQFSLRANPVVRRHDPRRGRSVKHDVVMDALRSHPGGERTDHRFAVMRERGFAWLERQAERAGFTVRTDRVRVDGYEQHRVTRKGPAPAMSFSTLDFDGLLTVNDPDAFLAAIAGGFGAAKAYGCGLMLIRRA